MSRVANSTPGFKPAVFIPPALPFATPRSVRARRLVTPLPELGLEFVPAQSETLDVLPTLGRSLSYMMGRTGNGMRMLACDDSGRLLVSQESNTGRVAITPTTGAIGALATVTDTPVAAFNYFLLVVRASNVVVEILDGAGSVMDMIGPNVQAVQTGFGSNIQYFQASRFGTALRMTEVASIAGDYLAWYFNSPTV